jgi:hypothetical protein
MEVITIKVTVVEVEMQAMDDMKVSTIEAMDKNRVVRVTEILTIQEED